MIQSKWLSVYSATIAVQFVEHMKRFGGVLDFDMQEFVKIATLAANLEQQCNNLDLQENNHDIRRVG